MYLNTQNNSEMKTKMNKIFFNNTTHKIIKGEHVIFCNNDSWSVTDKTYQDALNLAVNWFAQAYLRGEYDV